MLTVENNCPIYLRPIEYSDTCNILKWRNSEYVRKKFIYQDKFTEETHIQWMKSMINTRKAYQFIIYISNTNKPIGSIYLRDINLNEGSAEYGIFIGEEGELGKGYGTIAGKLLLQFAFQNINLRKVYLRVFADNFNAIQSYLKLGFTRDINKKDEDIVINGISRKILFMCIHNT